MSAIQKGTWLQVTTLECKRHSRLSLIGGKVSGKVGGKVGGEVGGEVGGKVGGKVHGKVELGR
jgi:hypothetical protein